MNEKAFTLVEMIAVFTIIGVILLITIPVTNRIVANNEEDKYTFYVETVEKAVLTYADMECSNSDYSQSVSLQDLIKNEYLKEFDDANVNYSTEIEFTKTNGAVTIHNLSLKFEKNGKTKTCSKTGCS